MITNMKSILSLTSLFICISCAHYSSGINYSVERDIHYSSKYKSVERLKADLYTPKVENAPLVVVVHGGGWRSRSKEDMTHVAKSLASNGFAVLNINYRLSPNYRHPAPVDDLHESITYLEKNNKYQINTKKVALWGYSSGGHTVSYYAMKYPDRVSAVVSGGAPYDFMVYPKSPYIKGYIGDYRDQKIKEYKEASPLLNIASNSPPFYLYHAESDDLVEVEQMTKFESALKKNKVKVKTYTVNFWGHMTAFLFSKEAVKQGVLFLKQELKTEFRNTSIAER